jgi:hypothetical protein
MMRTWRCLVLLVLAALVLGGCHLFPREGASALAFNAADSGTHSNPLELPGGATADKERMDVPPGEPCRIIVTDAEGVERTLTVRDPEIARRGARIWLEGLVRERHIAMTARLGAPHEYRWDFAIVFLDLESGRTQRVDLESPERWPIGGQFDARPGLASDLWVVLADRLIRIELTPDGTPRPERRVLPGITHVPALLDDAVITIAPGGRAIEVRSPTGELLRRIPAGLAVSGSILSVGPGDETCDLVVRSGGLLNLGSISVLGGQYYTLDLDKGSWRWLTSTSHLWREAMRPHSNVVR